LNQVTTSDFFPTATQRKTLAATDAELISIIRRQADAAGFVEMDVPNWARILHAWPESGADEAARVGFVRERIEAFVRLGLLQRSEKILDGCCVRGFSMTERKKNSSRNNPAAPTLTGKDRQFLRQLKVASW